MPNQQGARDPFRLDGRMVAVIGAGSGIGASVAALCSRQGARVACLDRDEAAAARTAAAIETSGGAADTGSIDVTDGESVATAIEALLSRHGRLDGVVCTPGLNVRKPLLRYTSEEFDRVVAVNLKGGFAVLRSAGAVMREAGGGSIVLFSSIRARVVEPGQGVYAASKAGVLQLVATAAAELGGAGVRVNAVAPGVVETPLTAPIKADPGWYEAYARRNALGRWARPEEMAGPTAFLLSDAASYLTGTVLYVDGGWTAIDGRFQPPGME